MTHKSQVPSPIDDLEAWKELTDDEPVPEWHLEIIAKRMAKYQGSKAGFKTLEEFWSELAKK